ncbi:MULTISPECIES: TlpA family protein disulfide reductase [Sphingobacterium]|uniref:TlpA family protein disulfide reductase n=1 Tax=Sphingobacterium TaxID=28453 RepID=UPI00257E2D4F|nr:MULTISPECIES: redoxin domain-containing protein [Sphingobacterium]
MKIYNLIIGSMLCLFISIDSFAQPKIDHSKGLHIGDEFKYNKTVEVINDKKPQFDFANYKEDLLVLDFFDTFCSSCIANMPKVVALQKEFGSNVKLIQVTWQDKKTIQDFFRTNKFLKEHKAYPTAIVSDSILHKLFPHQSSPHVVWIYKGKAVAITAVDVLNSKNIQELLTNGKINLPRKDDFLPLASKEELGINNIAFSKVSGFNADLKQNGFTYQLDSTIQKYRTSYNNMPLFNIYLSLLGKMQRKEYLITKDRVEWKVKDKTRYNYGSEENEPTRWMEKNAICYERIDNIQRTEQEQAKVVYNDMNNFFGLNVYYGKAKRQCLVLRKIPIDKTGGIKVENRQNLEGTSVLAFVIDYTKEYPPVIDEVKSKENIAVGEFKNIAELNQQLLAYGMQLTLEEREIEVVVFEEI